MKDKFIMCSSVTYALKGKEILKRKGFKVHLKQNKKTGCGCGYCLAVGESEAERAVNILRQCGVKFSEFTEYAGAD